MDESGDRPPRYPENKTDVDEMGEKIELLI